MLAALGFAITIVGCNPFRGIDVDCGTLDASTCEQAVDEIQSALLPQIQGRRIVSIELFSETEALITLDDGTPVGWNKEGRR